MNDFEFLEKLKGATNILSTLDIRTIPKDMLVPVAAQLAAIVSISGANQSAITLRIAADTSNGHRGAVLDQELLPDDGEWITVREATKRYPLSSRWFYRRAGTLPFIRRVSSKKILVHDPRLRRWLERTG